MLPLPVSNAWAISQIFWGSAAVSAASFLFPFLHLLPFVHLPIDRNSGIGLGEPPRTTATRCWGRGSAAQPGSALAVMKRTYISPARKVFTPTMPSGRPAWKPSVLSCLGALDGIGVGKGRAGRAGDDGEEKAAEHGAKDRGAANRDLRVGGHGFILLLAGGPALLNPFAGVCSGDRDS